MHRLRIAVYHNLRSGGALRAMVELLARLDHDVDLYESDEAARARASSTMDLSIASRLTAFQFDLPSPPLRGLRLGHAERVRRIWQLDRLDRTIAEEVNRRNYDVVIVNPCADRMTPAALRYLQGPVVYMMHEPRRNSFEHNFRTSHKRIPRSKPSWVFPIDAAAIPIAEFVAKRSDAKSAATPHLYVVCNSVYSSESILRAYGVHAHVSYLGVDIDRFRPAPSLCDQGSRGNYVLTVGRFDPSKNHHVVVRALAMLEPATRPALHIVADQWPIGEYDHALKRLADELGVDVTILSAADDDRLIEEYQLAVATVCAAELEPFGLTAIESLACGTPVVAIRQGGFREVVQDEVNGYLVDASPDALAAGISRALTSPEQFSGVKLRNWVIDRKWTWDDAAVRFGQHIHRATEAHRQGL